MIAALHSGLGSLKSLFGWRRSRTQPAQARDRQEARAPATGTGRGPAACVHADLALRRFTAYSLGASLGDLNGQAGTRDDMELLESARSALRKLELQPNYLPRRPSLLPRLMSAISSDSNSMRDLAKIIGDDGALLGELLRLANSSFYRPSGGRQIASLEKSVTLVGTYGIRSLVTTALLHPELTSRRGPFASFPVITWDHSQHAAAPSELHAQRIERDDPIGARLL